MKKLRRKSVAGFTLIELLVVISIISMLLSITMPSLQKAKEKGRQITCQSNLRQMTLAWSLYSQENGDKLVSPHTGNAGDWDNSFLYRHWVTDGLNEPTNAKLGTEIALRDGLLWNYTESVDLYRCASDRSGRLRNYALSFTLGGGQGEIVERDGLKPVLKLKKTSDKMVFIDSAPSHPDQPYLLGSFSPIRADIREWVTLASRSSITARHDNGCNVSFADCSISKWKWKDNRTVRYANKEIQDFEASGANEDLDMILKAMRQYN